MFLLLPTWSWSRFRRRGEVSGAAAAKAPMGFAELELVPDEGLVNVPLVEERLRATPHAFMDPHDGRYWFLCATQDSQEHNQQAREADPTRRPYCALVMLEQSRLWLVGEFAEADELMVAKNLVTWLLTLGRWSARDAGYGGPWREPLSFFSDVEDL